MHGNYARAAKAAGYSDRKQGWRLLNEKPHVKAFIDMARDNAVKEAEYDMLSALKEGEKLMGLAVKANQHTAAANFFKTLMTIRGFLDRRYIHEHQIHMNVDISGALAEARSRAMMPVDYPDEVEVEVEFKRVEAQYEKDKLEKDESEEETIEDLLD